MGWNPSVFSLYPSTGECGPGLEASLPRGFPMHPEKQTLQLSSWPCDQVVDSSRIVRERKSSKCPMSYRVFRVFRSGWEPSRPTERAEQCPTVVLRERLLGNRQIAAGDREMAWRRRVLALQARGPDFKCPSSRIKSQAGAIYVPVTTAAIRN